MKSSSDIEALARGVCTHMAGALERYARVSGEAEQTMPEHFAVAYILDKLGSKFCLTMETGSRTLWNWNNNTKGRSKKLAALESIPDSFRNDCGARRCDLVAFHGEFDEKYCMDFLCLVEIKKGHINRSDIEKINDWLPHIDTCPFGMVASYCEIPKHPDYVGKCEKDALKAGHKWIVGRESKPVDAFGKRTRFQTFAEYWAR
jgi:hypothetical protein